MSYIHFEDEMYKCVNCGKFLSNDDFSLSKTWKCPDCGKPLHIGVPSISHTLIRKLPADLTKNDLFLLRGETDGRMIFNIQPLSNNRTRLALKGYGSTTINNDEFVNTVTGGYFENSWKSNN